MVAQEYCIFLCTIFVCFFFFAYFDANNFVICNDCFVVEKKICLTSCLCFFVLQVSILETSLTNSSFFFVVRLNFFTFTIFGFNIFKYIFQGFLFEKNMLEARAVIYMRCGP